MGPNVIQIRAIAYRVIRGKIPAEVRKELNQAVKNKELGHLKKNGLLPEIYFHPDHLHGARDLQKREAEYSINCIKKIIQ